MSRWRVQPASGRINPTKTDGSGWDFAGGDPDPFVRMFCPATASSQTSVTTPAGDTLTPAWTTGSCTITAQALTSTGFAFELFDDDSFLGGADDRISPKVTKVLTDAELLSGAVSHGATSGLTSIRFTLTLVP
jgi:hypothetical protein